MKILQMPAYFLPHKGGIEYCVYNISKEFIKAGHKVKVITSKIGSRKKHEIIDNIEVERTKAISILKSPFSPFLIFKLLKENPDIVHLHHPHPFHLESGVLFSLIKKKPFVINCHGMEVHLKGWKNIISSIYNKIFFNLALKKARRIIVHTNMLIENSKYLTKYKDKTAIIRSGVDTHKFKNKIKTSLKKQLNLEKNKIILFVGALREYKSLDILITAFKEINKKLPETKLIIIGKGDQETKLKSLAKKLKLNNRILFQGFLDDNKLIEYYSIADLFILPSHNLEEGYGLVALEALSMGVPTVVTNGAGIAEVFKIEKIGVTIQPRNHIDTAKTSIELLKNINKRLQIAKKGQRVVKMRYNWSAIAKEYLKVYKETIK